MTARAFIMMVLGALALIGAGLGGYYYVFKKDKDAAAAAPLDEASFAGEDVEDALAVETPSSDIPGGEETTDVLGDETVEGDPWLDSEAVEGAEGSGDFVEDEPFEDVYDPSAGGFEGGKPVSDPIDPAELPQPKEETPAAEPEKAAEPQ
ncbi:MAG: hypothetical protein ABL957_07595 [Parvularculaceae bacterium]